MSGLKKFCAVIIGAPASGKGTISNWIIRDFKLHHISSGDLLRQNIKLKTELGIEAEKYTNNGQLVPDDIMIKCILKTINDEGNRWLLDGFPRTINQAEKLWQSHNLNAVIHLKVPFDVIIDRVTNRWIHLPSGRVYNIGFNDPKIPFRDDETGDELIQRDDDKLDIVHKRLEIYDNLTKPVLAYYKNKGILKEFPGSTSKEIWPKVREYLVNKNIE